MSGDTATLIAFTVGQVRGQLGFLEEEVSKAGAHYGAVDHLPGCGMHLVKPGCAQKKKGCQLLWWGHKGRCHFLGDPAQLSGGE